MSNDSLSPAIEARIAELVAAYGNGADGAAPTPRQWAALLARPADAPISLVNHFELRDAADYGGAADAPTEPGSGREAFMRYSAVSGPCLEKAGGRFLLLGPFEGGVIGADEDWDLVVVGRYPTTDALFALFDAPEYRAAWMHRRAAVARQRVLAVGA